MELVEELPKTPRLYSGKSVNSHYSGNLNCIVTPIAITPPIQIDLSFNFDPNI